MITTFGILVVAGLVIVATWAGWRLGRRQARPGGPTSQIVCSCGHGYGTHDNAQRCHGSDTRRRNGLHVVDPCPCRLYDGPEPLPRVWTAALDASNTMERPSDGGTGRHG